MALVETEMREREEPGSQLFNEILTGIHLFKEILNSEQIVEQKEAPNGYREETVRVPVDEEYLQEIIGLNREDLLRLVPVGSFMTGSRVRLMAYFMKREFSGERLRDVMESHYVLEPYDRMLGIRYSLDDKYLPEEIGESDLDIVTEVRNFPVTEEELPSRTYPRQKHARAVYESLDGKKKNIHYHSYPPMDDATDLRELHLRSEPTIFALRLEREDDNFYIVDPLNALGIGDEKSRKGAHDYGFDGDEVNPEMLKNFDEYPPLFKFSLACRASLNLITRLDRYYNKKSLQTLRDGLDPEKIRAEYEANPAAKESFKEWMRRALVTKIYSKPHFFGALAEIGILDFVKSVMFEGLEPEKSDIDRHIEWLFNEKAAYIQECFDNRVLWYPEMWEGIKKRGWGY